jgi:hypothetical protein
MRQALALAAVAVSLCGCASGYAYCYDPYGGPKGYYTGPLDPKPACAADAYRTAAFAGPYEAGYREPYVSGPAEPPRSGR